MLFYSLLFCEYRKYPKSFSLDHIWVATVWVQQLGLSQHSDNFLNNFVDGAVLNSLTRRDMERHLGITRKFHQVDFLAVYIV